MSSFIKFIKQKLGKSLIRNYKTKYVFYKIDKIKAVFNKIYQIIDLILYNNIIVNNIYIFIIRDSNDH